MKQFFSIKAAPVILLLVSSLAMLSAGAHLNGAVIGLAAFLKSDFFTVGNAPFHWVFDVKQSLANGIDALFLNINFRPGVTVVDLGFFKVPSEAWPLVIGIIFTASVILTWRDYDKALETKGLWDDIRYFVQFLIVLWTGSHLLARFGFGILDHNLVQFIAILAFIVVALFRGRRGFTNEIQPFLGAVGQLILYGFLMAVTPTARILGSLLDAFIGVGKELKNLPDAFSGLWWTICLVISVVWLFHTDEEPEAEHEHATAPGH